jgi:imidazole glycerol-phosphate synthase subunit HisH
MPQKLVIVNYGMGNLNSVKKAFARLKITATISSNPKDIAICDKIVLPGVGHFGRAMKNLEEMNLLEVLNEVVLVKKKTILGICLGMELMAKSSEEGNVAGLSWFDAEMVRFQISDKLRHKVPHTGWNHVSIEKESKLMKGINNLSEFYFVHSFHLRTKQLTDILSNTNYEYDFPSAIEKENLFGVQYHPEKSHDVGLKLLENFLNL